MTVVLRDLVRASHPEPCLAVTAAAGMLAVAVGHPAGRVALVAAAVLAGQLSIGWSNDWFDAARDRQVGRSDKPVARGTLPVRTVATAAVTAAAVTVALSLALGLLAGTLHLQAVGMAWLYNWPLKRTWASVVPYAVAFGLLPGFVVLALPGHPPPPWWLPAAGALLGAGAHFANTLPDFAQDARTGVRGLPHRIGATASRVATVALLLAAGGVVVVGRGTGFVPGWTVLVVSALALGVVTHGRQRYGDRLLFRVVLLVALADVLLLVTSPL